MSVFGLKLLILVIIKALLLLYNIDLLSIHETWNAKELCVFENAASGVDLFLYNIPFFNNKF